MSARTASTENVSVFAFPAGTPPTASRTSSMVSASASSKVRPSIIEQVALAHPVIARHPRVLKPAASMTRVSGLMRPNKRNATSPRFDLPTIA